MAMVFEGLKDIHNATMLDFAEKFNASPVAPNLVFIVNVADTGLADAVIVDLNQCGKSKDINAGILAVDWERVGSENSFKPLRTLKQQERKLKDWTDCAIQTNKNGKEVALAFTKDWLLSPKQTMQIQKGNRDKNGKPIRDKQGNWIGAETINVDVRYTSAFAVWDLKNIDNLKLCIAAAMQKGLKDKEAFRLHEKNGAVKSGHVYIPANLSKAEAQFQEPEAIIDQHREGIFEFANKFNSIDGWNSSMSNIIVYPLPCPGEYDAVFINMDNNTKMAVKFDEGIDWSDTIQFDELYVQQFKGVIADALGAGYEAPEGFYPDIEEQIKANEKRGMYTSAEHKDMDRVRLYSIKNAEPFIGQTVHLKNAFTISIRDADMLYDKIERDTSNLSLDQLINFASPTAGRPKKAWDSFSSLSKKTKAKQKGVKKGVMQSEKYLDRQKQLLTQRRQELFHLPEFGKKNEPGDR